MEYLLSVEQIKVQDTNETYPNSDNIFSYSTSDVELLAGMAAILLPILADQNEQDSTIQYQLNTTANLQPHRLKRHIREADIATAILTITAEDKVIWIRNKEEFFYDAYKFTTGSFLQGLFTIAHHFQADYHNYIYGLPYDGNLQVLEVPEYGLVAPSTFASEVPDIDDIEAEEVDDENILNPYERTDDLITITSSSNSFTITSSDEGTQEVYVV